MTDSRTTWRIQTSTLRRLALFLSMLMSGGILLIPRVPVLVFVIVLCLSVTDFRLPIRRAFWPLYTLLLAILVVTLVRPGPLDIGSLVIRFANFANETVVYEFYRSLDLAVIDRFLKLIEPFAFRGFAQHYEFCFGHG